jgi:hypothetical protein
MRLMMKMVCMVNLELGMFIYFISYGVGFLSWCDHLSRSESGSGYRGLVDRGTGLN